jgi:hypothetical protein
MAPATSASHTEQSLLYIFLILMINSLTLTLQVLLSFRKFDLELFPIR